MTQKTSRILSAIMFQVMNRPTVDEVGVTRYRELLEKSVRVFKPDPQVKKDPINIDGIQSEWLLPTKHSPNAIVLYIHGGGFIAGSINSHRDLASRIAKAAQARTLIFNYRLAPENPFPAGLEDARKVYEWLLYKYGGTCHITLAGDSAGGGLALALTAALAEDNLPLPHAAVFLSPWTDLDCPQTPAHAENKDKDFMINRQLLRRTARMYTSRDLSDPRISPIHQNFSGFPPTLIQVGANEILLDDSRRLAENISAAGSDADIEIWEGMFHVWHFFAKYLSEGRDAIDRIGKFIRTCAETRAHP